MKTVKDLKARGVTRWIIPAAAVVVIGCIGTYLLTQSHADSLSTPASLCGSGYKLPIEGGVTKKLTDGSYTSDVTLLINTSTKKFCAVNISSGKSYGTSKHMSIALDISTPEGTVVKKVGGDSVEFKYYAAGPVYISYEGYQQAEAKKEGLTNYNVDVLGSLGGMQHQWLIGFAGGSDF